MIHEVLELAEQAAIDADTGRSSLEQARRIPRRDIRIVRLRRWCVQDSLESSRRDPPRWLICGVDPTRCSGCIAGEGIGVGDRRHHLAWVRRQDRAEAGWHIAHRGLQDLEKPSSAAEAATSIQLAFYLVAAQADAEIAKIGNPTEAEFWHPLSKSKKKFLALDPSKTEEIIDSMKEIAVGIQSEDWTPKLGAGCSRCTIKLVCPLWPEGREAYQR